MPKQKGEMDRWRDYVEERHAALDYARLRTIVRADAPGRFALLHSTRLGRGTLIQPAASGVPVNPKAALFLLDKQDEFHRLACHAENREDLLHARAGSTSITRLLILFGQDFIGCRASEEQSVAIQRELERSFDDLRTFKRSPGRVVDDFASFRAGLHCRLPKAG